MAGQTVGIGIGANPESPTAPHHVVGSQTARTDVSTTYTQAKDRFVGSKWDSSDLTLL